MNFYKYFDVAQLCTRLPSCLYTKLLPLRQSTLRVSSEGLLSPDTDTYDNLIRYWGKRDTKLILPTNSSLSVTLNQDHLRSTTTSRADPSFEKDRLWLNGVEEEIKAGRLATCIMELKRLRKEVEEKNPSEPKVHIQ